MEIRIEVGPSGPVCDFCLGQPVVKSYACRPFVMLETLPWEHISDESWAACKECSNLIDSERWPELSERAVQQIVRQFAPAQDDISAIRAKIRELHQVFRANRIPES
jgi:hypothetical protein